MYWNETCHLKKSLLFIALEKVHLALNPLSLYFWNTSVALLYPISISIVPSSIEGNKMEQKKNKIEIILMIIILS